MKSVQIYPPFDTLYYSFYVRAVQEYFGESNIEFSYKNFPPLPSDYFGFIIEGKEKLRVVIDAYDGATINDKGALEWSDVFGKVNLILSSIPTDSARKCVAIGPSFPIQLWPLFKSFRNSVKHYRPWARTKSAREHFANYLRQYRDRLPLSLLRSRQGKRRTSYFSLHRFGGKRKRRARINVGRTLWKCANH